MITLWSPLKDVRARGSEKENVDELELLTNMRKKRWIISYTVSKS